MNQLSVRTPDDVKRLFSALGGVALTHESGGLSVAQVDELSLSGSMGGFGELDMGFVLSLLVAAAAGYSAIRGYERNQGSMPWGLGWGLLGWAFPVPSVVYSAVKN
jgi:hypothetical protein